MLAAVVGHFFLEAGQGRATCGYLLILAQTNRLQTSEPACSLMVGLSNETLPTRVVLAPFAGFIS
jgi:hypothetical protein